MNGHTKGPWAVEAVERDNSLAYSKHGICITDGAGGYVAEVGQDDEGALLGIDYANANLIAAAPDMYDLLEAIVRDEWECMDSRLEALAARLLARVEARP